MTLAITHSRAAAGIDSPPVTVEAHLANGLPAFSIVGLPEKAVQESRERVRAAILNAGYEFPARRITINLAPADLPKEGGRFDLAIAIGILAASSQVPSEQLGTLEFLGELALSGEIRSVNGALPAAVAVAKQHRALVIPHNNREEASRVSGLTVYPAGHLLEVTSHLAANPAIAPLVLNDTVCDATHYPDIRDVIGQEMAKRALTIAAAGRHSMLMSGPPGSGKSMLASRLPGLLPALNEQEALETASIHSVAGYPFDVSRWRKRPFRTPHHSASGAALVGGGTIPRPGEISLAHHGVLFLDELPEFHRSVLEALREPLENGTITISRAGRQAEFPARFQLVAAMNPCHCGYLGHPTRPCTCSSSDIQRYQRRLSGPLLDRVDIQLEVGTISGNELVAGNRTGPGSNDIRNLVTRAIEVQMKRQQKANAFLNAAEVETVCAITPDQGQLMLNAIERLNLSHRAYHRILKLARTISDLAGDQHISTEHLTEAIRLRILDSRLHL